MELEDITDVRGDVGRVEVGSIGRGPDDDGLGVCGLGLVALALGFGCCQCCKAEEGAWPGGGESHLALVVEVCSASLLKRHRVEM